MEIKLYFRMLQKNWWLILLTAMTALTVSLAISYAAVPQFSSVARFIIIPSSTLTSGADVVRSLDTLDRRSVVATYAEVMNSTRILEGAAEFLGMNANEIILNYQVQAVDLPDSSVLELTVSGPNPALAAELANAIGFQSISFTRGLNLIYELNFLDTAIPAELPFSPEPLRDGLVALVLGTALGGGLAVISEQIRVPIEAYRQRRRIDSVTGIYNASYFSRLLEEEVAQNPNDVLSIGIVELNGLSDYLGTLPPAGLQSLLVRVKEILRRELRGHDIVGRWDEISFSVMLPTTDGPAASRTFDRIYQALSQPMDLSAYGVTVSLDPHIGGAVYSNTITARELIEKAETSLEQSRRFSVKPIYVWEMKSPFWVQTDAQK
ncbi:MAG TPA: diguanylate cyclase [Anaerolineales bacterium]|nr:diguanylate cyclase [Anaerolineales bacterium]